MYDTKYDTTLEPASVTLAAEVTYCTDTETMTDSADYPFVLQRPWELPPAHRPDQARQLTSS